MNAASEVARSVCGRRLAVHTLQTEVCTCSNTVVVLPVTGLRRAQDQTSEPLTVCVCVCGMITQPAACCLSLSDQHIARVRPSRNECPGRLLLQRVSTIRGQLRRQQSIKIQDGPEVA